METINKDRFLKKKGTIMNAEIMEKITKAIQIQIGVFGSITDCRQSAEVVDCL